MMFSPEERVGCKFSKCARSSVVERVSDKDEVASSILAARTLKFFQTQKEISPVFKLLIYLRLLSD